MEYGRYIEIVHAFAFKDFDELYVCTDLWNESHASTGVHRAKQIQEIPMSERGHVLEWGRSVVASKAVFGRYGEPVVLAHTFAGAKHLSSLRGHDILAFRMFTNDPAIPAARRGRHRSPS